MSKKTKDIEEKQIAGLNESDYNQSASAYSKSQITWWLIAGVVYSIYQGSVFSVTTILLFLPGIFIISLASIPFFLLRIKKIKAIEALDSKASSERMATGKSNNAAQVPVLIFYTFTSLVGLIFPIISAVAFVYILNGWLR